MGFRQDLREIAVALVGDDDRRARFRDQEIRAGDADIGGEKFFAQDAARLARASWAGSRQVALGGEVGVDAAEIGLDLIGVRCTAGAMMCEGVSPRS